MTFFRDLRARPPLFLSLKNDLPAKAPSKHDLQKLWAQGVVMGRFITSRQIRQLNSAYTITCSKWKMLKMVVQHQTAFIFKRLYYIIRRPFSNLSRTFILCDCLILLLDFFPEVESSVSTDFLLVGGGLLHFHRLSFS